MFKYKAFISGKQMSKFTYYTLHQICVTFCSVALLQIDILYIFLHGFLEGHFKPFSTAHHFLFYFFICSLLAPHFYFLLQFLLCIVMPKTTDCRTLHAPDCGLHLTKYRQTWRKNYSIEQYPLLILNNFLCHGFSNCILAVKFFFFSYCGKAQHLHFFKTI